MRVFIVANVQKPKVRPAIDQMVPWVAERAELVGVETNSGIDLSTLQVDRLLVFGGDGTLLSTARRLNGNPVPVMGVNFGRLGFLASFTPAQFKEHFAGMLAGKLPISSRLMLEASVVEAGVSCVCVDDAEVAAKRKHVSLALNDAVISAGAPFRMIELMLGTDSDPGIQYYGDGLIVSSPSGSTAYNASAGGPILSPSLDGICLTPICPHSLSFRPMVMPSATRVIVTAKRVNRGTTLSCDGQASVNLKTGDRVIVRRASQNVLLVENPDAREWRTLAEKLHWAASPRYNPAP